MVKILSSASFFSEKRKNRDKISAKWYNWIMTKNNDHSTNSTTFFPNYQLFLPMDIGVNISESSPVRVISKLLEGLDYQAYSKNKGRKHKIEADK